MLGIHDVIRDALRDEIPMQPKAIASGLIATDDRRLGWKREPRLRPGNLIRQDTDRAPAGI